MNNISLLGPQGRLDRFEYDAMKAFLNLNDIIMPEFEPCQQPFLLYQDTKNADSPLDSSFNASKVLDFFSGGTIIPLDLVRNPHSRNCIIDESYRSRQIKYIHRPDFLFISYAGKNINVYPIDLKTTITPIQLAEVNIGQVSAYNLAIFFSHSSYLRKAMEKLKEIKPALENKKIVLQPGCYIFQREPDFSADLEKYLEQHLHKSMNGHAWDEMSLAFSKGSLYPALADSGNIFSADSSFFGYAIDFDGFAKNIRRLKNRLETGRLYPNLVAALDGFNSSKKPKRRFEYSPLANIETYDPSIDDFWDSINSKQGMGFKELQQMYAKEQREKMIGQVDITYDVRIRRISKAKARIEKEYNEVFTNIIDNVLYKKNGDVGAICNEIRKINGIMKSGGADPSKQVHLRYMREKLVAELRYANEARHEYHTLSQKGQKLEEKIKYFDFQLQRLAKERSDLRTSVMSAISISDPAEKKRQYERIRQNLILNDCEQIALCEEDLEDRRSKNNTYWKGMVASAQKISAKLGTNYIMGNNGVFRDPQEIYLKFNKDQMFHIHLFDSFTL